MTTEDPWPLPNEGERLSFLRIMTVKQTLLAIVAWSIVVAFAAWLEWRAKK